MFRFYSNENLAAAIVNGLRQLGHDVLTSYEAGNANQGIPDEQVLATATESDRCIITFNHDDFLALHRQGIEHAGIVICKDDPDRQCIVTVLHNHLINQQTLSNRLLRILKTNQPGVAHPILAIREYPR